ncbi:MAG: PD-(D/E)XK nuclease family protein [Halioglobus sp.]
MPNQARHSFYNLEPLKPLIESDFTLLTPNFRLARRIKAVWDAQQLEAGRRAWTPLKVMPLESWCADQWALAVERGLLNSSVVINDAQAIEIWQRVIDKHQSMSSQYSLLRPGAAASIAQQARENLLRWQVDLTSPETIQQFELDADCSTFLSWQSMFEQVLAERSMATNSDCTAQLITVAHHFPKIPVALLDFDDIPPLYRCVVEACASEMESVQGEANPGTTFARTFTDKRSELMAAARWAKRHHDKDPESTSAIILPSMEEDRATLELFLRDEFDCLETSSTELPVNFSAGVSLDKTPAIRDAVRMLKLALPSVNVPEVVALLQSRFAIISDVDSQPAIKFVIDLFGNGREEIDTGELRHSASHVRVGDDRGFEFGEQLMALSQLRGVKAAHFPSAWIEHFDQILAIFHWPGEGPLSSVEYQQVEMWYQLRDTFSAFDPVVGSVQFSEALQLLSRCLSRQIFQPQTPDSAIQVLGLLEGAGLNFDNVWLCTMQASSWPPAARPNPVIPISLQRSLQMPHASPEREWMFASGLMQRYVCAASEVNASYVRTIDGIPELPSPLLKGFEWLPESEFAVALNARWIEQRKTLSLESVTPEPALEVSDEELPRLRGGSGLVEDQSHCPFRAFAKRRLGVEALGEFQIGLSPAMRGSILHDALYALWGEVENSERLASLSPEDLDEVIERAVEVALKAVPSRERLAHGSGYLALEGRRLQQLLAQWILVEKEREQFSVYAREEDVSLRIEPLEIRLRVDRIDQLADGSLMIIDYKSGRSAVKDWLGDRPSKPQLLLYGIAASDARSTEADVPALSALAFAQVRARDCAYRGVGSLEAAAGVRTDIEKLVEGTNPAHDWQSLNDNWRQTLEQLVADFVAGEAQVSPLEPNSCTYCGLQSFCRIGLDEDLAQ